MGEHESGLLLPSVLWRQRPASTAPALSGGGSCSAAGTAGWPSSALQIEAAVGFLMDFSSVYPSVSRG